MTRNIVLRWLERLLAAGGLALGAWCIWVLVQAHLTQTMPLPPPPTPATQSLPADGGSTPTPPATPRALVRGAWVARLEAPSINMTATVLEGSDDRTLRRGAGHIEDTPLPGQPGNVGIAGHRDSIFRPLRRVQVGDPLTLTTADRAYQYRVSRTLIVGPEDVSVLDPTHQPTLTLVTCYPFILIGHAPKRFVVQAELIKETARAER